MAGRDTTTAMSPEQARRLLGVAPHASWPDIRSAYRAAMRRHHPDLDTAADATARAARLNAAVEVLRRADQSQTTTATTTAARSPSPGVERRTNAPVLEIPAGDVFVRMLEAAHDVGEVSYIDPEAGLIQLLLGAGGPAGSQLLIAIDSDAHPPTVAFTLDSMNEAQAPDIRDVVRRLSEALAIAP